MLFFVTLQPNSNFVLMVDMIEFMEMMKKKAAETNAAKFTVRYFQEDGGEFEITYKRANKCNGYGHRN